MIRLPEAFLLRQVHLSVRRHEGTGVVVHEPRVVPDTRRRVSHNGAAHNGNRFVARRSSELLLPWPAGILGISLDGAPGGWRPRVQRNLREDRQCRAAPACLTQPRAADRDR